MDSAEEYRRAIEELEKRTAEDPQAAALLRELVARLGATRKPAQRVALISDIHGNHDGLLAVLQDIEQQKCDAIMCLGDLVDGGPQNEQVIATLRARGVPCVRGNHDENNDLALPPEARRFLQGLPERLAEGDVLYVHISPRAINRKINHEVEAWNVFEDSAYRLTFVGHVHVPYIFGRRCEHFGQAERHAFQYNQPFRLAADDRYIVSVGSVGYGRDRVGKIRYAIHDRSENTVELRAIEGPLLALDEAFQV